MVRTKEINSKHTQFSLRFDDRELQYYLDKLGPEMNKQMEYILDTLAQQAISKQIMRIMKHNPHPVQFEERDKPKATMGEIVANSLRHRISESGQNETRLSIFSEPYPSGAKGSRGGRIAQYLQEGVAPFTAITPAGQYFQHIGFPALDYMGEMNNEISMRFREIAEGHLEKNLKPNGSGARPI